jgi:hypothetical protein
VGAVGQTLKRWYAWRSGALVGAALVLLGAGSIAASRFIDSVPTAEAPNGDAPVNEGARDAGDISANNSPTLARNPRRRENLAVVNRIDTPQFSCALHVSFDGGSRWSRVPIEIAEGEGSKCYAPDVTFTSDGRLHMSYVTLRGPGNVPSAAWLVTSEDGGRTLSEPRKVIGPLAFQVRLTADPNDPRRLYLSWVQASGVGLYKFERPGNPILMARSADGGSTWGRPVQVNDASRMRAVAPSVTVGPKGEVYALYLDLGDDRLDYEGAHEGLGGRPYAGRFKLVLGRSRDHGATWDESVVDDGIVPIERFIAFLPSFPSVAVDPETGRVYAGFHDERFGTPDVLVWSRAADGAGWEGPTRVNDTPERDGSSQYLPKLSVAPGGRVDVVYYDRRSDPKDVMNEVSLQSSLDHGRSFGKSIPLSNEPFDSRIGYGSERDLPDLGSRLGLLADDSFAYAVWTDTRAGSVDSNKQDLALARVAFSEPAGPRKAARYALGYGGAAIAVAGLLMLGSALRRQRASGP